MIPNSAVDTFLIDGCGRCKFYATPSCKVHLWTQPLIAIRAIALQSGLTEEIKWGVPVYTLNGKNILIIGVFREYCSLGFFKGVLLTDSEKILVSQGENVQSSRIIRFTHEDEVKTKSEVIKAYISEAIEIEKRGEKVIFNPSPEPIPDELVSVFAENPTFESAFFALPKGKQRGYIIYFSQPKQSATRISRILSKMEWIFQGIGMHDHYKSKT